MNAGRIIIVGMIAFGCTIGGLSVWMHHEMSRRVLSWWSADAVQLIQTAPRVDAVRLAPLPANSDEAADHVTIGGQKYAVVKQIADLEGADGMSHLRDALLVDGNYDWTSPPPAAPHWQFGLQLIDGSRRLTVAFDFTAGVIGSSDSDRTSKIAKIATGWQEFFAERFPDAAAKQQ